MFKFTILIMIIFYLNKLTIAQQCDLKKSSDKEKLLLKRLDPLLKKNYYFKDEKYNYYFAICDKPKNSTNSNDTMIGLVQERSDNNQQYVVGRLNDVDLEGNDDWIYMVYRNGDNYTNACNRIQRKANILIFCDRNAKDDGEFSVIEENTDRDSDCAYVFQLKTNLICTKTITDAPVVVTPVSNPGNLNPNINKTTTTGFSIFGIICLIVFSIAAIYLIGGILFLRFGRNYRGWQQVPHFRFWNRIGNFQADLCDYVCRCNNANETNAQPYENLTGQFSDDENMLNV